MRPKFGALEWNSKMSEKKVKSRNMLTTNTFWITLLSNIKSQLNCPVLPLTRWSLINSITINILINLIINNKLCWWRWWGWIKLFSVFRKRNRDSLSLLLYYQLQSRWNMMNFGPLFSLLSSNCLETIF